MFEIALLVGTLLLGIITSIEDIRDRTIRNKWILIGFVYALVVHMISFSVSQNADTLLLFVFSLFISLITCLILYFLKLWSAGDGKLAFVFTLFLAPVFGGGVITFPIISLLFNSFLPIFFYFLVKFVYEKFNGEGTTYFKLDQLQWKSFVNIALALFVLMWAYRFVNQFIPINKGQILIILLLLVLMRFFSKKSLIILGVASAARFFLDSTVFDIQQWIGFGILLCIVLVLKSGLNSFLQHSYSKRVPLPLVKKGMIMGETILKDKGKYWTSQKVKTRPKVTILRKGDVLTQKAASSLRKHSDVFPFSHILIQETVPFAPFLFAGALITFVFSTDLFDILLFLL